jgi:hypothetical protein
MKKFLVPAAAALLAASALPALAQPPHNFGPTPGEENSMFTGTTVANGSAVIVTDRNGTHPDGYPGMATRNPVSGNSASTYRGYRHDAAERGR